MAALGAHRFQYSISLAITWKTKEAMRKTISSSSIRARRIGLPQRRAGAQSDARTISSRWFRSAKAAVEPLRKSVAIRAAVARLVPAATPITY